MRSRAAIVAVVLALAAGAAADGSATRSAPAPPCGIARRAPHVYRHVLLLVLENHAFTEVAGSSPYLTGLARSCGLADRYFAVAHPSLPNYLALTSGSTDGISSDCTACSVSARSLFEQVGAGWRSYLESLPSRGYTGASSGDYAKRHNPAAYYARIAARYATNAVPLESRTAGLLHDLARDRLPRFALIVPNLCHDEHDCSVATGDAWLRRYVPRILRSRAYRAGGTALFVTYDEGTGADNRVYTVVASATTRPGTVVSTRFDHYSLLRTIESLLGLPCLAHACGSGTASMRAGFGL
ncbi:MAG TPA: alkaline phosphatase family protein [Gaiellaceae bacterium]|nr:alkaline phosphatase family protein [Gaiellaceae bacterium]